MPGLLSGHRILDLSDEKGLFCGRVLSDLGADVVVVEPPSGNPARERGPYFHDIVDKEKSLPWFFLSAGKRGVTLDISRDAAKDLFKKMVARTDFLIESFRPGYMDGLGLGYEILSAVNPQLIYLAITPYGQSGPCSRLEASDLVIMGLSGLSYLSGDPDRAPVRITVPQWSIHGGEWGCVAALAGLHARNQSGRSQFIDLSLQEAASLASYHSPEFWSYSRAMLKREGTWRQMGRSRVQMIYPCKDGHVTLYLQGGVAATIGQHRLAELMAAEGIGPPWLKDFDFFQWDIFTASQKIMDELSEAYGKYILPRTKRELFDLARKIDLYLAPLEDASDIVKNPQLRDRGFFVKVNHDELGQEVEYPGPFVKIEAAPLSIQRRAPLIGEHNDEVYRRELGLGEDELAGLKQAGVV